MKPLLTIFLTVFLDLVGFGLVIPLLPYYAETYGASLAQVAWLMASYSLAQFLFAPVWGSLSDRYGRRPILLVSIAMGACMLAGFAWANTLWLLFLFRTLHGIFAANISTAQAYIADITTPENRAKGMGLIGAAFGLGFTLGPWIGGELSVFGLSTPIWGAAGLSALNFLLATVTLKESLHAESRGRPRPRNPRVLLEMLRHPTLGKALTQSFIVTLAFAMMESTFALYEEHVYELTAQDVGRLLGLMGLVMVLIQGGLIGRLVKRFGEGGLICVGIPGLGIAIGAIAFAPPGAALSCVCALLAICHGITLPSLHAVISKSSAADKQGIVLGTNHSLAALARAIGPVIGGTLISLSLPLPLLASGAVLVLAGLLARAATTSAPEPHVAASS